MRVRNIFSVIGHRLRFEKYGTCTIGNDRCDQLRYELQLIGADPAGVVARQIQLLTALTSTA